MAYQNKIELENGNVILYTREGAKKLIYHMRIYVHGLTDIAGNTKQYITESTRESNKDYAIRAALDRYEEVKANKRYGIPTDSLTFNQVFELWLEDKGKALQTKRREWFIAQNRRYWTEYFGAQKLDQMQPRDFASYWDWRNTYWHRFEKYGKKKPPVAVYKPSRKTLTMEQGALRQVFVYASSRSLSSLKFDVSLIQHPQYRMSKKYDDERRPSFSQDEWTVLDRYMRDVWVEGKGKDDSRCNVLHLYQRQLVRRLVQLIQCTGVRVGEAINLRHRDIEIIQDKEGTALVLQVDGKTGKRNVISLPTGVRYYKAICELTDHSEPDDWVICNKDGTQYTGYEHAIRLLLKQVSYRNRNLYIADNGKTRSLTSFRHYYAEERVRASKGNERILQTLSVNMGTSRLMLDKHYVDKILVGDREGLTRYPDR